MTPPSCWLLKSDGRERQTENDSSFIGGQPCLPTDTAIPICSLCGNKQTFFFQVAFPEGHVWAGYSLAVFSCTSCAHQGYLIPAFIDGPLPGANVTTDFINSYCGNFQFLMFRTGEGEICSGYEERVNFIRWQLIKAEGECAGNKIGGTPNWLLEDEAPATYYDRHRMVFLLQIEEDFQYPIVSGAPGQMKLDYSKPTGAICESEQRYYELFVTNALYLFGANDGENHHIYAILQCD